MVSGDSFRHILGNFATGVTVVTFPTDTPHGLTANAVSSVSLEPPLVLVCIDKDTTSYQHLESGAADGFCINILSGDQQHLGEFFAGMTEPDTTPFESEPTTTATTGATIFEESLAYIDCTVWADYPGGDHTIYVGEVQDAEILNGDAPALTFFRGEWTTLD